MNLSSNLIGNCKDETNFPHKLLSKDTGTKKLDDGLLVDTGLNMIDKKNKKKNSSTTGSRITLTNKEIKYVIKTIKSLENGGILLKGTTRKPTSQEERFLNCLKPLMTAGLPLMVNVFTLLTKSVLIPLGLTVEA